MENKLYRSRTDRWLLGVCGGLGKYFGIDPILIRLLTILLAFSGVGIVAYFLFAIFVPVEQSTRNTMEGVIQDNANDIQQTAQKIGTEIRDAFSPKEPHSEEQPHTTQRRSVFLALVLIGIGLVILFSILGKWAWFGIVWAVILVATGVAIIVAMSRKK